MAMSEEPASNDDGHGEHAAHGAHAEDPSPKGVSADGAADGDFDNRHNLMMTLEIVNDDDELSSFSLLMTADSSRFSVNHLLQARGEGIPTILSFKGSYQVDKRGVVDLQYALGTQVPVAMPPSSTPRRSVQYRDVGWEASIKMPVGAERVIMESNDLEFILSIEPEPMDDDDDDCDYDDDDDDEEDEDDDDDDDDDDCDC